MELLEQKKNIYSISVQDITTRATVNRSTFYAHFEDKYAFLENWMTEKFQMILRKRLPDDSKFDMNNLRTLIQTIFDFLIRFRQYMTPGDKQFEPMFEIAMQKEVHRLLLKWLSEESIAAFSKERVEATALVLSWGIFGSAMQYSRSPQDHTVETMVKDVLEVAEVSLVPVWVR
ncbi:TetR/AcrR family transcriptional regulator [Paenibacillus piri]|nr:TetR family transcriptional regulator [Paenibacillus piri]